MGLLEIITVNYTYCLIALLSILFLVLKAKQNKRGNYPPGPKGFPLLGYLPFVTGQQDVVMSQLADKYGDVVMFPVGSENVIILNTLDGIKESFVKQGDTFAGRRNNKMLDHGISNKGIFCDEGNPWKEQRKFILNSLREFGMGKVSLEDSILDECNAFVKQVKSNGGKPFNIGPLMGKTIVNILSGYINGERFDYDDPKLIDASNMIESYDIAFSQTYVVDFFPMLRHLPAFLQGTQIAEGLKLEMNAFLDEVIDEHKKTFDEHKIRDFTDSYIQQIRRTNSSSSSQENVYNYEHLKANQLAMFVAGSVTSSMTLGWAVKLLMSHPHVQEKLITEIDQAIGRERHPSWLNRNSLPYTEAVLHEVQRYADIIPIGVPHTTMEDAKVLGFDIPKRSYVFGNYKKIHSDPKIWGDPQNFRPERFLDATGTKLVNTDKLFVFGVGRRRCVGEALARMNLFHILVSLLQNFTLQTPDGAKEAGVTEGLIRYLLPFEVIAKPRL